MSKVRVFELAKELQLESSDVEGAAEELGIDIPQKHLSYLSPEEVDTIKALLKKGRSGALKETRVDATIVRRRRKSRRVVGESPEATAATESAESEEAAAPAPTRRRRVQESAPAEAEPAAPEVETPSVESAQAESTSADTTAAETVTAASVAEAAQAPAPQEATKDVPAELPQATQEKPEAVPAAAKPVLPEATPAPEKEVAQDIAEEKPEAQAEAEEELSSPESSPRSLVQVVRQVDDAIMQNIINEANRRARQETEGRGRSTRSPRRSTGRPNVAIGAGPAPGPGAVPAEEGNRRRGKGRVAWERGAEHSYGGRRSTKRGRGRQSRNESAEVDVAPQRVQHRVIKIDDTVTVGELASHLSVKSSEIIKKLMMMGEMVTVNHVLDMDTVQLLAEEPEFNFSVENVAFNIEDHIPKSSLEDAPLLPRDPVVTVMGHVDHGKTSLLDAIRKARVASGEAGGITQHIGAYKVPVKVNETKRQLVFLDTPGHAAFSAMRARGAQVTDVVILVVAADDGVMPQTQEAINHAKAAGVPIVVAVNKCDKPDANPDKVRQQLTEFGVVPEEWGGDTQFMNVSAKAGQGIDELLELVALQADILELKAPRDAAAKGVVIEAKLSRGRGPVATVLVQEGTLKKGDIVVAGTSTGRVRALLDHTGKTIKEAGPATPVAIVGLDSVPEASEQVYVVNQERDAKAIVSYLSEKERKSRMAEDRKKVSLDDLFEQMESGEIQKLNLVIKSDVQGSLEALQTAFGKLKHPELELEVIHSGVGGISEHDVNLASASNAIILGFNVRPEKNAKTLAEQYQVDIKLYSVIYTAVEDMKAAMEGLLEPHIEERFVGRADVRDVFHIPKVGTIAGCAVLQGKLVRNYKARLIRDQVVIFETTIDTLRRFKDQVTEVERGHECGARLENYNDIKVGDEIECYELIEIAQKLELEDDA